MSNPIPVVFFYYNVSHSGYISCQKQQPVVTINDIQTDSVLVKAKRGCPNPVQTFLSSLYFPNAKLISCKICKLRQITIYMNFNVGLQSQKSTVLYSTPAYTVHTCETVTTSTGQNRFTVTNTYISCIRPTTVQHNNCDELNVSQVTLVKIH